MQKRYFWRRGFAYFIDLFICSLIVTLITLTLNNFVSSKILPPPFIKSSACHLKQNLVSPERVSDLLRLEEGQRHIQMLCKQTNMLTANFHTTTLQKIWSKDVINYKVGITYYSDNEGNQVAYIPSDPFLYIFSPLLLAFLLSRFGKTPGKYLLSLHVYNTNFEKPDLKSALIREYTKSSILFLSALFSLYTTFQLINSDLDSLAQTAHFWAGFFNQINFGLLMTCVFVIFIGIIWFHIGSFIRWRGRTYWDQLADLSTNHINAKPS